MKQKVCWVEKLKKIIESKSLVSHTFNWAYFCQKRLFLPQSKKALEDEFLQNGHFPLHRWRNSILYEHVPSEYVPSSYPLLLQNWCLLGIVRKIDNFTAEAYSHLSHHKGSKVLGGAATIPGGRSDMIVSGNDPSAKFDWWIWKVSLFGSLEHLVLKEVYIESRLENLPWVYIYRSFKVGLILTKRCLNVWSWVALETELPGDSSILYIFIVNDEITY